MFHIWSSYKLGKYWACLNLNFIVYILGGCIYRFQYLALISKGTMFTSVLQATPIILLLSRNCFTKWAGVAPQLQISIEYSCVLYQEHPAAKTGTLWQRNRTSCYDAWWIGWLWLSWNHMYFLDLPTGHWFSTLILLCAYLFAYKDWPHNPLSDCLFWRIQGWFVYPEMI